MKKQYKIRERRERNHERLEAQIADSHVFDQGIATLVALTKPQLAAKTKELAALKKKI